MRRPAPRIEKLDLNPAREFLEPDWGRRSLVGWAQHKFGFAIDPASRGRVLIGPRSSADSRTGARQHYALKEAELPVRIALTRFVADRSQHMPPRYDREGLAAWATERFHTIIDADEIRPLLRAEIEAFLLKQAHDRYQGAALSDELGSQARRGLSACSWSGEAHRDWRRRGPGRPGLLGS